MQTTVWISTSPGSSSQVPSLPAPRWPHRFPRPCLSSWLICYCVCVLTHHSGTAPRTVLVMSLMLSLDLVENSLTWTAGPSLGVEGRADKRSGVCRLCTSVQNLLLWSSWVFVALKSIWGSQIFLLDASHSSISPPDKNSILKSTHLHVIIAVLLNTVIFGGRILLFLYMPLRKNIRNRYLKIFTQ